MLYVCPERKLHSAQTDFFFFFTAKPNVKLRLNCCPAATTSLFMEELKEFLFQICDVLAGYVNNINLCVCRSQQMATDW